MLTFPPGLEPVSRHFAALMAELAGTDDVYLQWGALAACEATLRQNACADLRQLAGTPVVPGEALTYPALEPWLQALQQARAVVGLVGDYKPLILDQERLYLYRYWQYETRLAADLRALCQPRQQPTDLPRQAFQALFPPCSELDWQALAAGSALLNGLTVIAGGPGTGKTTTVARILALLLATEPELRVALAAPTGKAAARMKQALERTLLALEPALLQRLPEQALTLHRLLGAIPGSHRFRHDRSHPLPYEVVIVDEASMIDLALMSRLVEAIRPGSRLILLGDPDQLASVEAGCVLGDICRAAEPLAFSLQRQQALASLSGQSLDLPVRGSPLDDQVIQLQISRRFGPGSGIGALAQAVNAGEYPTVEALLADTTLSDIHCQPLPKQPEQQLLQRLPELYGAYLQAQDPQQALQQLEQQIILAALRQGPAGVESLNRAMEVALQRAGYLSAVQAWYHLRPVLITENNYLHGLFNGDLGVTWNPEGRQPRIWFAQGTELHSFSPSQLGAHETAWALTVHKSQGSEFQRVLLVLPPEPHALLSRELIYTGITRARQRVEIWGDRSVLQAGIERRVQRSSGLVRQLTGLLGQREAL